MNTKILILLLALITLNSMGMNNKDKDNWTLSPFCNTRYLKQYKKVEQDLTEKEGFSHETFKTTDQHTIHGLFYNPKGSKFSIIFCAGWLPGRKEGMIPFYPMLKDQKCSMFFFDARGHGDSDGSILKNLPQYGQNEYKDIIAAIKFVHKKKHHPIYILGICAGAFHGAHALIKLHKKDNLTKYNIKGFIFDSGWTSFTTVSYSVPRANIEERLAHLIAKLCCCRTYHHSKNPWIKKCAATITAPISVILHTLIVRLGFTAIARLTGMRPNEQKTNLHKAWAVECPNIPILFIHSFDDPTDIKNIQSLAKNTKNSTCWWIEKPSKHACHNLIYKKEYREKLLEFFKNTK